MLRCRTLQLCRNSAVAWSRLCESGCSCSLHGNISNLSAFNNLSNVQSFSGQSLLSQSPFSTITTTLSPNKHSQNKNNVCSMVVSALLASGAAAFCMRKQIHQAHCWFFSSSPPVEQEQIAEVEVTAVESDINDTEEEPKPLIIDEEAIKKAKWEDVKITLYQYQTCPFCSKARSFLIAHGIPFEIVEVHPIFKNEIKFTDYKKVPIVTLEKNGNTIQINDSSVIISALSSYVIDQTHSIEDVIKLYPTTTEVDIEGKEKKVILNRHWLMINEAHLTDLKAEDLSEEAKWRAWADDYLVHLISPNVYRTLYESYQAFDYHVSLGKFHGTWEGVVAKYGGALAMWGIGKLLKKRYKLSENVRVDLYRACNEWMKAVGTRKFMGGDNPNLADLSVFGVLSVMENLAVFDDVITHSKIKRWYFRTKDMIESHQAKSLFKDCPPESFQSQYLTYAYH